MNLENKSFDVGMWGTEGHNV